VAAAPNAAVLADYLKTRVHAAWMPTSWRRWPGWWPPAARHASDAARWRRRRSSANGCGATIEVDKDRRHQLDLLALQNDVNKAALATQSALGVGRWRGAPAGAVHAPWPPGAPGDRFCGACGAPLHS
jgi:hypothetical protein